MTPTDQAWVTEFLRQKLGLMWISRTTAHETSLQARNETPSGEAAPSIEDVQHRFLAIEIDSAGIPAEPRWSGDAEFQETAAHTRCDRQSEKILREAHRILRGIVAIKADRVRSARDPIADN
jgi:hypothetical protein